LWETLGRTETAAIMRSLMSSSSDSHYRPVPSSDNLLDQPEPEKRDVDRSSSSSVVFKRIALAVTFGVVVFGSYQFGLWNALRNQQLSTDTAVGSSPHLDENATTKPSQIPLNGTVNEMSYGEKYSVG